MADRSAGDPPGADRGTHSPRQGAVYLLTDYGWEDEFAGLTRAVVVREAPGATVVDLSHGVPPFDVRAGALMLSRSVGFLGPGVVVAVVDPGVGSGRRGVAVAVDPDGGPGAGRGPGFLVGPDNGLLGWAIEALGGAEAAVALSAPPDRRPGRTFDGRDVFGPIGARLWAGAELGELGERIEPDSLVRLSPARLTVVAAVAGHPGEVEAEVVWVDRFGNAQLAAGETEVAAAGIDGPVVVEAGGARREARRVGSFAELDPGEVGVMIDANGRLALVCGQGAAATVLGVRPGETVRVRQRHPGA